MEGRKRLERTEGDHGSIVAFRVSPPPSVAFHPSPWLAGHRLAPLRLPLHLPSRLAPLKLSSARPHSIVACPSLSPSRAVGVPFYSVQLSTLYRRTCTDMHASLRRPRPVGQTQRLSRPAPPRPRWLSGFSFFVSFFVGLAGLLFAHHPSDAASPLPRTSTPSSRVYPRDFLRPFASPALRSLARLSSFSLCCGT